MALSSGTRLGPYEILEPLGAGGMGEVYRARDSRLGREVAVKVLPAERLSDPARRARFVQEARAASALNHPHIVTIHEIESAEGLDFIVMKLLPGKTLDALIPRSGMRLGEALRIGIPLADALAAAHAAGMLHRDLKPANVMVTPGLSPSPTPPARRGPHRLKVGSAPAWSEGRVVGQRQLRQPTTPVIGAFDRFQDRQRPQPVGDQAPDAPATPRRGQAHELNAP
jgi:serine/threonine protein kinase